MKKLFLKLSILLVTLFILSGCDFKSGISENDPADNLTIYTINDFHGAIQETAGAYGIARMGEYMLSAKETSPNETIILSAGDMFQGSGLSYVNKGKDVINMMNMIEFDAMTIGNHEFDWELSTVINYFDGDKNNGEADFPLLGANIIQKSSNSLPNHVDEYTIIERGGLKIGIVGYIGYGLESDIATGMVSDYEFLQPSEVVGPIVEELRTTENCQVVIALGHDGSDTTNTALANLSGNQRIDAIVNGHLHNNSYKLIDGSGSRKIPVVQAGSSGQYVGVINFSVDQINKSISNPTIKTVKMLASQSQNQDIIKYVDRIVSETAPFFQRIIGEAGKDISVYDVRNWAPNVIAEAMNVEVAFINSGGIRSDAFPINQGSSITVEKVYQIMPFDNMVKTCRLLGSDLRTVINIYEVVSSDGVEVDNGEIKINGELLDDKKYYHIAAIDYIFDKTNYPFLRGIDIVSTGKLYRDVLIEAIEDLTDNNQKWNA